MIHKTNWNKSKKEKVKVTRDNYYVQQGSEVRIRRLDEVDQDVPWNVFTLTQNMTIEGIKEKPAPIGWRGFEVGEYAIQVLEELTLPDALWTNF